MICINLYDKYQSLKDFLVEALSDHQVIRINTN